MCAPHLNPLKQSYEKSIIALSCLTLVFFSCKKVKDENESVAVTTQSVAGTYAFGSATMKTGSSSEQDFTNDYYESCVKDDKIILNADGSAVYSDAVQNAILMEIL